MEHAAVPEKSANVLFHGTALSANMVLVKEYLDWLSGARNRTPQTLRTYANTLGAYVGWTTGDLLQATAEDMELFVGRQRTRAGGVASPATRRRDVSILRSFYQWANERGRTDGNVAERLHGPTVHNKNPRPIPDDHWNRLWLHDLTHQERVAFGLGFLCGLRRNELVLLTADQVGKDTLYNFKRKGGGEHTVPWRQMVEIAETLGLETDGFRYALQKAESHTGRLLHLWTEDPQIINKRLTAACRAAGLPHYTPHQLRHSTATNLLRAGVPLHLVTNLMNHSSPAVTMRYVRAGADELAAWRRTLGHPHTEDREDGLPRDPTEDT